ncbi:hypothetical protein GPJ56_010962 [Histomonas meleagridis]|uniref:uncharacterized protein n=1 Tax=Histomonas meleagridis TaxID=135588 RepID=UPI00355A5B38|nr:hypothetical protein GPJ56_010962 [Histomonas meleagridis]KAH0800739.1 hypothetical protein GO595_006492 [Histomonas meleagridis]
MNFWCTAPFKVVLEQNKQDTTDLNNSTPQSPSKTNEQDKEGKILYVCRHCNNISYLSQDFLNPKPKKPQNEFRRRSQGNVKGDLLELQTLIIQSDSYNDWEGRHTYENLRDFIEKKGLGIFPFCPKCSVLTSNIFKSKVKFYTKESKKLKDGAINSNTENVLNQKLAEINAQMKPLRVVSANTQKHLDALLSSKPTLPECAPIPTSTTIPHSTSIGNSSDLDFNSIMLASTFRISTFRHYATINGNRIGTNTPDPVQYDEFDSGLYFLVQLLQAIGRMISSPITSFNLTSEIQFINSKGVSDVFTSLKLKSSKTIASFREATKLLFKVSHKLFWDLTKININFSIPNEIDLKNSKISGESYIYDPKKPYLFTYAIKRLVMDLKMIQARTMQSAVYKINKEFNMMKINEEPIIEKNEEKNEEERLRHIESQFLIASQLTFNKDKETPESSKFESSILTTENDNFPSQVEYLDTLSIIAEEDENEVKVKEEEIKCENINKEYIGNKEEKEIKEEDKNDVKEEIYMENDNNNETKMKEESEKIEIKEEDKNETKEEINMENDNKNETKAEEETEENRKETEIHEIKNENEIANEEAEAKQEINEEEKEIKEEVNQAENKVKEETNKKENNIKEESESKQETKNEENEIQFDEETTNGEEAESIKEINERENEIKEENNIQKESESKQETKEENEIKNEKEEINKEEESNEENNEEKEVKDEKEEINEKEEAESNEEINNEKNEIKEEMEENIKEESEVKEEENEIKNEKEETKEEAESNKEINENISSEEQNKIINEKEEANEAAEPNEEQSEIKHEKEEIKEEETATNKEINEEENEIKQNESNEEKNEIKSEEEETIKEAETNEEENEVKENESNEQNEIKHNEPPEENKEDETEQIEEKTEEENQN